MEHLNKLAVLALSLGLCSELVHGEEQLPYYGQEDAITFKSRGHSYSRSYRSYGSNSNSSGGGLLWVIICIVFLVFAGVYLYKHVQS